MMEKSMSAAIETETKETAEDSIIEVFTEEVVN